MYDIVLIKYNSMPKYKQNPIFILRYKCIFTGNIDRIMFW